MTGSEYDACASLVGVPYPATQYHFSRVQAQITQLQAELKRLLDKIPRRGRETIAELDKKIR